MKNLRIFLCCAAVGLLFSGCKPIYQLLVQGEWVLHRYYQNGDDQTNWYTVTYDDYKIKFYDDGDFTETYTFLFVPVTVSGTWEIERKPDGKFNEYQLVLTSDNSIRIYDIAKMSKNEIDISRSINENTLERILLEPVPE